MPIYKVALFLYVALWIGGCSPSSLDEYREEGSEKIVQLIKELKAVHTREQLAAASPRLKRLFNDLIDVMIAARQFHEKHPEADLSEPTPRTLSLSYQLRQEIERLYEIDGCREIIEKCQEEALFRLDTFEKKLKQ